jgi:hypothetical protein
MGDDGRELFRWLAGERLPAARRAGTLSLYLRWRRDRAFVFDLMDELGAAVRLPPLWRSGRVLRFLAELSITIYVNNPSDPEVIQRTSRLWRTVLRKRLRLDRLAFLLRAPLLTHLQAVVSARTLQMALLPEIQDPGRFFRQSPNERERFLRVVPLLDPSAKLSDGGIDDLLRLLDSDIVLHRILAALVVGARHVRDPHAGADLVSTLRRDVDGRGLLWLLLAHAIPPPDTSEGWIPQLESMTQELAERHPATFAGDDEPVLRAFDAVLLPLAFAYAGERRGMPLIEALLADGLEADPFRAARVIRGLAAVGVYDPVAMFSLMRPARAALDEPVIRQALVATLGSVRALYFDLVDVFLEEVRIPDPIRREVLEATDDRLVDRCVQWGGYYGNAIHACTTYPVMRQALVIDALDALGRAHDPSRFLRSYTPGVLRLLEQSDFELLRWTRPEVAHAAR